MKKRLFVAVAAVAAVAVAGGAYAWATGAGGGAVAACAQKVNGQLRLDNGTGCRPSEDAVALAAAGTGAVPMYAHVDGGALDVSRSSGVISMAYRVVTIGPAEIGVYCFDLVSPASNVSAVGALGPASAAGIGFSVGIEAAGVAGTTGFDALGCPSGADAAVESGFGGLPGNAPPPGAFYASFQ